MKATHEEVQKAIRLLTEKMVLLGLAYDSNETTVEKLREGCKRVTWASSSIRPDLSAFPNSTIEEYVGFIKGRHYNVLLKDGAIFQFSYDIEQRNEIYNARAIWFPCPIDFDLEELEIAPLDEIIETTPTLKIGCRAPIRLDFSPRLENEDHPCTHIHSGLENFRLPVQRPMEPSRFVRMIMRTAYPAHWKLVQSELATEDWGAGDRLSANDRHMGYLGWVTNPPVA